RARKNRTAINGAEQLDARVDKRRIMEPARPQLDVLENGPIRPQRRVIVAAAGHIRPVTRRYFSMRGLLEVEHIEGAGRVGDDIGSARRTLRSLGGAAAERAKATN